MIENPGTFTHRVEWLRGIFSPGPTTERRIETTERRVEKPRLSRPATPNDELPFPLGRRR